MPNLSNLLQPLNSLLQDGMKWSWSTKCEKAFQEANIQIASAKVLTPYDPALPIKLADDASAYGVSPVISHRMPDWTETPIAFASHTLTSSEENYAQLEKEALSLVYKVKKFHRYLYNRKFTSLTDHQPLTTILNPNEGIPFMSSSSIATVRLCYYQHIIMTSVSSILTNTWMLMDYQDYLYLQVSLR